MGFGIANELFDPVNCNAGFTLANSGVGYYNGIYLLSDVNIC